MLADWSANIRRGAEDAFEHLATGARRRVLRLIAKQQKLVANLRGDLEKHGDPDRWKRFGDLILSNIRNAERRGDVIFVTDYYDDTAPSVEIEGDAHKPLSEIAEGYFRQYTKARNGLRV